MDSLTPEQQVAFAEGAVQFEKQLARAGAMTAATPGLNHITAIIIAGDLDTADRAKEELLKGVLPYRKVVPFVGSYARVDFAVWAREHGYVTDAELFRDLPELWRGSDPDDTDPRFLALWLEAWEANGRKTIRDGRGLPLNKVLDIYRGQDPLKPGEIPGIAWSLDRAIAEKFAKGAATRESNRRGIVLHATVARKDVMAYLTGRGEKEVIVNPMGL